VRIVVTGASGNVGTALLCQLTESGNGHELIGVVRRSPEPAGVYRSMAWHELDIAGADARDRLRRIFDGADAVVHLAWGFQPTRNTGDLTSVGVRGTSAVVGGLCSTRCSATSPQGPSPHANGRNRPSHRRKPGRRSVCGGCQAALPSGGSGPPGW
jgi:hypothetical protein